MTLVFSKASGLLKFRKSGTNGDGKKKRERNRNNDGDFIKSVKCDVKRYFWLTIL